MNCTETKRYLDLFLDGELAVESNLKVLEHLNLCGECSRIFDGEKWLKGEVRAQLGGKAPEALRGRVVAALDREASPRRWWLAAAAAAAVLAAAGGWAFLRPSKPKPVPPEAAEAVAAAELAARAARRHNEMRDTVPPGGICVCGVCAQEPQEAIEAFLARHGQQTCLHDMEGKGFVWKSAAVWKDGVRGRLICWTVQVGPKRSAVSHATLPAEAVVYEGGREVEGGQRWFDVGDRVVVMGRCGPFI